MIDLDRIERYCAEATEGAWVFDTLPGPYGEQPRIYGGFDPKKLIAVFGNVVVAEQDEWENNCRFAAFARTDLPALVRRCRELEAILADAGKALDLHGELPLPKAIEMTLRCHDERYRKLEAALRRIADEDRIVEQRVIVSDPAGCTHETTWRPGPFARIAIKALRNEDGNG